MCCRICTTAVHVYGVNARWQSLHCIGSTVNSTTHSPSTVRTEATSCCRTIFTRILWLCGSVYRNRASTRRASCRCNPECALNTTLEAPGSPRDTQAMAGGHTVDSIDSTPPSLDVQSPPSDQSRSEGTPHTYRWGWGRSRFRINSI